MMYSTITGSVPIRWLRLLEFARISWSDEVKRSSKMKPVEIILSLLQLAVVGLIGALWYSVNQNLDVRFDAVDDRVIRIDTTALRIDLKLDDHLTWHINNP